MQRRKEECVMLTGQGSKLSANLAHYTGWYFKIEKSLTGYKTRSNHKLHSLLVMLTILYNNDISNLGNNRKLILTVSLIRQIWQTNGNLRGKYWKYWQKSGENNVLMVARCRRKKMKQFICFRICELDDLPFDDGRKEMMNCRRVGTLPRDSYTQNHTTGT